MNENLNLVEILKDCPKGTKLYSSVFGEVEFDCVKESSEYPIKVLLKDDVDNFTKDGRIFADYDGECMLFPSKDQRDWSKFKPKKPKFDPNTLQPFDKVLVRNKESEDWRCQLFSHITEDCRSNFPYICCFGAFKYCIPYNDDTKCLVGVTDEAPKFYRY